jgi:hypothetical protein
MLNLSKLSYERNDFKLDDFGISVALSHGFSIVCSIILFAAKQIIWPIIALYFLGFILAFILFSFIDFNHNRYPKMIQFWTICWPGFIIAYILHTILGIFKLIFNIFEYQKYIPIVFDKLKSKIFK